MFARLLIVIPALAVLSACVYSDETSDVHYTPLIARPVSDGVPVSLTVTDGRTTNRTRISVKLDGYGADAAPIRASRPVPDIVRDAVALELRDRGFPVVTNARIVNVTIENFYSNYVNGTFPSVAAGDVKLAVTVSDGPRVLYSNTYDGRSDASVFIAAGNNAADSVAKALQDAIGQMFSDAAFVSALTIRS
jgi:uncharacterized lipoprotein